MKSRARTARLNFTGSSYVTDFVLPNFYFHESMTYALLRHNGVEVGKMDFLGRIREAPHGLCHNRSLGQQLDQHFDARE